MTNEMPTTADHRRGGCEIRWHKGDEDVATRGWDAEPGEWYAEVNGVRIAHVTASDTPTGYWGHYRGFIPGNRRYITDTLASVKDATARAYAARQASEGHA